MNVQVLNETTDSALYMLRQLAAAVTGLRRGFEEYLIWWGPAGGNLKGTLRKLMEELLGTFTGGSNRGYSAVVPPEVVLTGGKAKGEGPSEVTANLRGSRAAFVDDFATVGAVKLDAALLRRWSGGNRLTAARKNRANEDFEPDFGLNILVNSMPEFHPLLFFDFSFSAVRKNNR